MDKATLYPLRFQPIYQYRLWGGRRLGELFNSLLPGKDPIGEAWLLSDRDDHLSRVADGPLKGWTIAQLMTRFPEQMMGALAQRFVRFPLLLKFLDVRQMLSVQVHPADDIVGLLPNGEGGKTEAWVVLDAKAESRIYAGLKSDIGASDLRALSSETVDKCIASFTPKKNDGVFIAAGTVHALGQGVVVFEVQQNSDVTFRLFDWNHIDPTTGHARALQVEQALACIDFERRPIVPVTSTVMVQAPVLREQLFACRHFELWRIRGTFPFIVGVCGKPRIAVCIEGQGILNHGTNNYGLRKGEVTLLPADVGACTVYPEGQIVVLEIGIPELA